MICTLCSVEKALHNGKRCVKREHIPPKCLFLEASDQNGLITVPSCAKCNQESSRLDEEFKTQLSVMLARETNATKEFWNSAARTRLKTKKLHDKIDTSISPILQRTPEGYRRGVELDRTAMDQAIKKIIRGLHWHVTGQIIHADSKIEINPLQRWESPPAEFLELLKEFGQRLIRGSTQFEATCAITTDEEPASIWFLAFHGISCFWVEVRQAPSKTI